VRRGDFLLYVLVEPNLARVALQALFREVLLVNDVVNSNEADHRDSGHQRFQGKITRAQLHLFLFYYDFLERRDAAVIDTES
jgi:hypothetical protein